MILAKAVLSQGFINSYGATLSSTSQRGCGGSVPGEIQKPWGHILSKTLQEGLSREVGLDDLSGPFHPESFCDPLGVAVTVVSAVCPPQELADLPLLHPCLFHLPEAALGTQEQFLEAFSSALRGRKRLLDWWRVGCTLWGATEELGPVLYPDPAEDKSPDSGSSAHSLRGQ